MGQLPSVSVSTVSLTLKLILFFSEITMLTSNEQNYNDTNKVRWIDVKGQSKVWNRFLDIPKKEDGSFSLISKEDSLRRQHNPWVNSVAINENLQPVVSVSDNLTNSVFQEIVNFVAETNNKFNSTNNQVIPHAAGEGVKSIVMPREEDNSSNVLKFVSNSVQPMNESNKIDKEINKEKVDYLNNQKQNVPDPLQSSNNTLENAIIEQLKNNLTLQTLLAHILNNTDGSVKHNAKLVDKSNFYKNKVKNKKIQEIKNIGLITNTSNLAKEPYFMKNQKTKLIADSYMLKKNRGNITDGNKGNKVKIESSNNAVTRHKTRTTESPLLMSTIRAHVKIVPPKGLTDVNESEDDDKEQTKEIVEASSECVKFFHHIVYNISDESDNNGSKKIENGFNMNSPDAPDSYFNLSDVKVLSAEDSMWTVKTKKTSQSTDLLSSTEQYSESDSLEEISPDNSFTKVPDPKKPDSSTINVKSKQDSHKLKAKAGVLVKDQNGNEEDMKLADHLNDQNVLLQLLEGIEQILPGQDKTKDLNKNVGDEPEPVLKDLDKEHVDDSMKDVLNDMLGIKSGGGDIIWKENKAALKEVTSQNKLNEKNGTDLVVSVSTECVKLIDHTKNNVSEDLRNNRTKIEKGNGTNNSLETLKANVSYNDRSDTKININGESSLPISENLNMINNSNQRSNIKEVNVTTERNIDIHTPAKISFNDSNVNLPTGKLDSNVTNLNKETISHDQPKVNVSLFVKDVDDNELKDMGLLDHVHDQNFLLQVLESLDPILPPQDKTKDLNYERDDDPELVRKDLANENVDDNRNDVLNDLLNINHGDVIREENEDKEIEIDQPINEDNLENKHIDTPIIASIDFP